MSTGPRSATRTSTRTAGFAARLECASVSIGGKLHKSSATYIGFVISVVANILIRVISKGVLMKACLTYMQCAALAEQVQCRCRVRYAPIMQTP